MKPEILDDISYEHLNHQIQDMKKIKASLGLEITQNQILASNYRDSIKALESKINEHKSEIKKLEESIGSLKLKSDQSLVESKKERLLLEAQQRDAKALRERLQAEQEAWYKERAAAKENLKNEELVLSKRKKSLDEDEIELKNTQKGVQSQLDEIAKRHVRVGELEITAQAHKSEVSKKIEEADRNLSESVRVLDEANAKITSYDSKFEELKKRESEVKDHNLKYKSMLQEIDKRKKDLDSRERDIVIERHKVSEIKYKLLKEIEFSNIPKKTKDEISDELK